MYYSEIKHCGYLRTLEKFLLCFQMPVVFYQCNPQLRLYSFVK